MLKDVYELIRHGKAQVCGKVFYSHLPFMFLGNATVLFEKLFHILKIHPEKNVLIIAYSRALRHLVYITQISTFNLNTIFVLLSTPGAWQIKLGGCVDGNF